MHKFNRFKKVGTVALSLAMAFSIMSFHIPEAKAANNYTGQLKNVLGAAVDSDANNVVYVTFNDGVKAKITFLDNGIFRYNVDLSEEFSQYADPNPASKNYVAKIQAQPDTSKSYSHPKANVAEEGNTIKIVSQGTTIEFNKENATMKVLNADGKVVMQENSALTIGSSNSVQSLKTDDSEYFYGGGTQNGRFTHKGQVVDIINNGWVDGGVASPNPFYWSTNGYGVMRNTFRPGSYDFAKTTPTTVSTTHNDKEFDAYYFVSNSSNASTVAKDVLKDFYKVTGNPALLPEYSYYLAQLNCYNRDAWTGPVDSGGWVLEDGKRYRELGASSGYVIPEGAQAESLNNEAPTVEASKFKGVLDDSTYKFSARAVIDGHSDKDMPFGWFLPNDGYGCGYGQNGYYELRSKEGNNWTEDTTRRDAALDANIANLKSFTDYANQHGVQTGLWTQSALTVEDSEVKVTNDKLGFQNLRDFNKEVNVAGVAALKTDVAWVGSGFAMALNSVKTGYDTVAKSGRRPNVVSLYGWAGTQRYASIWTGDQTGGEWEYIRFHIPTYIGQSLSGNPNVGSDLNGIHGGGAIIQTRDFQWKTFSQIMLDMDGWGSEAKKPYTHGDPYTSINRMYLKMKAQLMPYLYTEGYKATDGLPAIRAMFLNFPEDPNTYGKNVQYQYMFGENLLVAPIYQNTKSDTNGNDVRDGIYLPGGTNQIWIDYFTGKQYRGGQTINNFDAPIWKLPLFVKNGAIVPMYEDNNNPSPVSKENPKGLDKSKRMIEFWPAEGTNTYDLFEDDGISIDFQTTDTEASLNYGGHVNSKITSTLNGTTATLTTGKSTGNYEGYQGNKKTTFVVNVSEKPSRLIATNGSDALDIVEAQSLEDYNTKAQDDNLTVYYYDAAPDMNAYAKDDEAFKDTKIINSPKLYVKFARTNADKNEQKLVIEGFKNNAELTNESEDDSLAIPTISIDEETITARMIDVNWTEVANAQSYDLEVDGMLYNFMPNKDGSPVTSFAHKGLEYNSTHTYRVRARGANGYSAWSNKVSATTLIDPWKDAPAVKPTWTYGQYADRVIGKAFDHVFQSGDGGFHSAGNDIGKPLLMDMSNSFNMNKLEYYPRDDNSNGTVSKMKVEISLDGQNWKVIDDGTKNLTFAKTGLDEYNCATWDLTGLSARYIRMTAMVSKGNYFSAREIIPWKVEDSVGRIVGDIDGLGSIDEPDLKILQQYAGIGKEDASWGQVSASDINYNGIFDIYDYTYTAFNMNGGTKQKGTASGNLLLTPNKSTVKAGETFSIDVYGEDMKNVNALGSIIEYNGDDYDVVEVKSTSAVEAMGNYSKNMKYGNKGYLTLSFVNVGDQPLISGTKKVATITLKALKDGNTLSPKQGMLIGPDYKVITTKMVGPDDEIDIPDTSEVEYEQNDFDITMTNALLPTDDGTNVTKLIQQTNGYTNLFNDVKEYIDGKVFELKWDWAPNFDPETGKLPPYITLPTTMHFTFKTPSLLSAINYYNRASGNGSVVKMDAVVYFEDGTSQNFSFTTRQALFGMEISAANRNKKVTKIDITPKESNSVTMLTVCEIDFLYNSKVDVESVALSEDNPDTIHVNRLVNFNANVTPANATNPYLKVTSSDPDIIRVIQTQNNNVVKTSLMGLKPGTATIHVASVDNPTIFKDAIITVSDVADYTELQKLMDKFDALYAHLYTPESYEAVKGIAETSRVVLTNAKASQDDVDSASSALDKAFALLVTKGSNVNQPSSTKLISNEGFKLFDESSFTAAEQEHGDRAFDGDETTMWHSNYNGQYKLPQWITVDLGEDYKLEQVDYLPRQGGRNGHITHYRIDVSQDGEKFIPVVEGFFANDGYQLNNPTEYKEVKFDKTEGRYVRFIALESLGDSPNIYASIAELKMYGANGYTIDEAIKQAEKVIADGKEDETTTSSWNVFMTAYDAAVELTKQDPPASAEALKLAADNLLAAKDALVTRAKDYEMEALKNVVAQCKPMEENFTANEFANMKALLVKADELLASDIADVAESEVVTLSLNMIDEKTKLDKLLADSVLLKNLALAIKTANGILASEDIVNIRPEYVQALKDAVAVGQALLDAESKDKTAITNAIDSITKAAQELYRIVDKNNLLAAIAQAEGYNKEDYTANSWKVLETALLTAKEISVNDNATTDQLKDAYTTLLDAMSKLVVKTNFSALNVQIQESEKIIASKDNYIPSTIKGLEALLNNAKALREKIDVTQSEVDTMSEQLTAANMKARLKADKKQMEAVFNEANKLNLALYTESTGNRLKSVLAKVEKAMSDPEIDQQAVDEMTQELKDAVKDLITKPANPENPSVGDINKGDETGHSNQSAGVNTGDATNISGMILLLMLAGCGMYVIKRRKKDC